MHAYAGFCRTPAPTTSDRAAQSYVRVKQNTRALQGTIDLAQPAKRRPNPMPHRRMLLLRERIGLLTWFRRRASCSHESGSAVNLCQFDRASTSLSRLPAGSHTMIDCSTLHKHVCRGKGA